VPRARRLPVTLFFIFTGALGPAACGSQAPGAVSPPADPLPGWNAGPARQAIVDFVTRVTTSGSSEFVPVQERIATFDNDGTLWSEQPVYFQFAFALVYIVSGGTVEFMRAWTERIYGIPPEQVVGATFGL
jgi:hypothetical protein